MSIHITLFSVIKRYHSQVQEAIAFLKYTHDCEDLITCLKAKKIPRRGIVDGIEFSFHGIGCCVEMNGYVINWDFGPGGRVDGFEAWKLWEFTRNHEAEFGMFSNLDYLRGEIEKLITSNQVYTMQNFGLVGNMVFLKSQ